jgi:hypothetical protein
MTPPSAVPARPILVLAIAVAAIALVGGAPAASAAERRAPNLLSVESVRVGATTAPVVIQVKVPRDASVRARVNGRSAGVHFHRVGRRIRSGHLTTHNGLRGGLNHIRLRASLPGGRYDVEARTVRLRDEATIADAGRDLSALVGETLVVGGAGPPGVDEARNPRWRIARAPGGSQTGIVDPQTTTPELTPDVNGTYVLHLTVAGGGRTAHDTITITARPPDPPIGVALETLSAAPDGAIRIDGAAVPDTSDRNGVFVAVLERTTRKVVESGTVPRNGIGIDQLKRIAAKWGGDDHTDRYLMIVSGPKGLTAGDVPAFNDLVTSLGGEELTQPSRTSLANGRPFSIVGIPGGVDGAGWTKIPVENDTELHDPLAGNIRANLQLNQAAESPLAQKHYDLVSPDHLTFDTRAAGAQPTGNTILIGGQTLTAELPAGATAGFHVALLDSMTGAMLANTTLATNGGGFDASQQDAGAKLREYSNTAGQPLLIVQSIGHPRGANHGWEAVAEGLRRFGSSFFVAQGLGNNDHYALVGQVDGSAPAPESSTSAAEDGELSGILSRDRNFRYSPMLAADELSPVTAEMFEVAYQPPQPFPAFASDGEKRAETYIGIGLGFCSSGSQSCEMRRRYYENYDGTAWGQKYNDLRDAVRHPGGDPGFTPEQFESVKAQLLVEISALVNIKNYFDVLQKPFVRVQGRSLLDLQKLGDQLKQDVAPDGGKSTGWALQLMAAVLAIASEGASEALAPALSATAGAFGLVSLFADDDGSPVLADEITANVNDLGGKLADRYEFAQRGTTGVALLMVSDWGKMQAVRGRIDNTWKLPPTVGDAIPPLELAANQWFARALVPSVYPELIWVTPKPEGAGNPNGTSCAFDVGGHDYQYHKWRDLPSSMQVQVTLGFRNTTEVKTGLFATRGFTRVPSAAIGNLLFNAPDARSPGLGLHPLRFFDPALFGGRLLYADDAAYRCHLPF